jgi:hypothetical protein
MRTKINKAKAMFTENSLRNKPATTAGHSRGTEPKPGENTGASIGKEDLQKTSLNSV